MLLARVDRLEVRRGREPLFPLARRTGNAVAAVDGVNQTRIYVGGLYKTTLPGSAAGWYGEDRVVLNTYTLNPRLGWFWDGGAVYDLNGTNLKSVTLPTLSGDTSVSGDQIFGIRELPSNRAFFRSHNQIRDISTDTAIWSNGASPPNQGDLVKNYAIYLNNGHTVTFASPP